MQKSSKKRLQKRLKLVLDLSVFERLLSVNELHAGFLISLNTDYQILIKMAANLQGSFKKQINVVLLF